MARAGGGLPLGTPGQCRFESLERSARPIIAQANALREGERLPNLEVDLRLGTTRLLGTISERWAQGVTRIQYSKRGPKHLLASWISHLALCAAAPSDQALCTVHLGRHERSELTAVSTFAPVPDARALLEDLVELYWLGQQEPLLFFPRSSYAFCETFRAKQDLSRALESARRHWDDRWLPERADPHLRRLFGEADVLQQDFTLFDRPMAAGSFLELAVRVVDPLLSHVETN